MGRRLRMGWLAWMVVSSATAAPLDRWLDDTVAALAQSGCRTVGAAEQAGPTAALGGYVAARLQTALRDGAAQRWQVIETAAVSQALAAAQLTADQQAEPQVVAAAVAGLKLDGLIRWSARRGADTIRLAGQLVRLPNGPVTPLPAAELPLDGDLLALSGASWNATEQRALRPKLLDVRQAARLDAERLPPAMEPNSLFRLELLVGGRSRLLVRRDGEAVARFDRGETYALRLTNKSSVKVGVALFIDGLNTVGQQRELPSAGLKWILDPGQTIDVAGWQLDSQLRREFKVVDAEHSVAGRLGVLDQLGLITASFYAEAEATPAGAPGDRVGEERRDLPLGTGEGAAERSRVTKVSFKAAETPAATLAIRYEVVEARVGG